MIAGMRAPCIGANVTLVRIERTNVTLAPKKLSVLGGEGRVEGCTRLVERGLAQELQRLRGTALPVHPGVLPFDRQRPLVPDLIEDPDDPVPRHIAVPDRYEIPPAAGIRPRQVRAQSAVAPVELPLGFLAVHVVDAIPEFGDKSDRVEVLPHEMARVEVQP